MEEKKPRRWWVVLDKHGTIWHGAETKEEAVNYAKDSTPLHKWRAPFRVVRVEEVRRKVAD
jgi:hypothetical protein